MMPTKADIIALQEKVRYWREAFNKYGQHQFQCGGFCLCEFGIYSLRAIREELDELQAARKATDGVEDLIDDTGSVLPMIMSEHGEEGEPTVETIICDCISGGANYRDNMPQELSLLRTLEDGTEYRMRYVQKVMYIKKEK